MNKRLSSNWINPSFNQWNMVKDGVVSSSEDYRNSPTSSVSSKKIKRNSNCVKYRKIGQEIDISWVVKYAPETKDELAVHKKKIQEVENWLKTNLYLCDSYQHPGLLLLTGPAGTGKTATIKVLANELKFEIQEWTSVPCESMPYKSYIDDIRQWSDARDIMYQNQHTIFSSFLLRVKYPSLFTEKSNRVILIEEFPNFYLKDPVVFHNLLRKFCKSSKCPAVFIMSDSTLSDSLENHLFPKNIQAELNITNISFNPVAPTMMTKALTRICSIIKESGNVEPIPGKDNVEDVTSGSMGDIRSAINSLQFSNAQRKLQNGSGLKRKKSDLSVRMKTNQRDSSLFLFHALGKILYCKRDNISKPDFEKLPHHLSHLERYPLISNPEEVFEKTSISADNFALFLHENFLAFVDGVNIATQCLSYLSDADVISIEWSGREVLKNYSASVASRGLMFNIVSSGTGHRWRAIHKPQYFATLKESRNQTSYLRNMFKDSRLSLKELETEFIPYLFKIGTSSLNIEEAKMVHHIGRMAAHKFIRCQGESLSEKDLVKDEIQSQVEFCTVQKLKHPINTEVNKLSSESEDDVVIEEYD